MVNVKYKNMAAIWKTEYRSEYFLKVPTEWPIWGGGVNSSVT